MASPYQYQQVPGQELVLRFPRSNSQARETRQEPAQQNIQWMVAPQEIIPGCPPGLEYLTQVDQLLVHQQVELLEVVTGFETKNKYKVKNAMGQQLYFAAEDSNCFSRQCLGSLRPFHLRITDNTQREVIHIERPYRCKFCCCFCCLQEMEVQSPPGTVVGYIRQDFSLIYPWFTIQNAEGDTVLKIKGPCCKFFNVDFEVLSADGTYLVGKIGKQWSGLVKEYFTDADNFGIEFPMDLDVKIKAVLLGACFLIDFMYFENNSGSSHRRR